MVSVAAAFIPFLRSTTLTEPSWARTCNVRPCRCSRKPAGSTGMGAARLGNDPRRALRRRLGLRGPDRRLHGRGRPRLLPPPEVRAPTPVTAPASALSWTRATASRSATSADGPAASNGQIRARQNLLVAYMSWKGLNYETPSSKPSRRRRGHPHLDPHRELRIDRETKLGEEESPDIPNVSEESSLTLDERGIIRIGAEVRRRHRQ